MKPRILLTLSALLALVSAAPARPADGRYLYVAVPGIRNYLEYGGHGVLVFDVDHGHKFVRRIPAAGRNAEGKILNVKGVAASAATGRLYVSTLQFLTCFDLLTDRILWEKSYVGGCDRMALSPDGKVMYLPSLEQDHWHVIDALTGDIITRVVPKSGAHNTVYGLDGRLAYPSTGEVVDVASRRIVAALTDETGAAVHSEKVVEIHFAGGIPVRTGDQFGVGRVR